MKKVISAALLLALSCVPSLVRAQPAGEPPAAIADSPTGGPAERVPVNAPSTEAGEYAAREAATPALGAFEGGSVGIYIGGSALTIVLVVLLIVIIL
jgi:hypothetical protein